jgi:hypothetical protein
LACSTFSPEARALEAAANTRRPTTIARISSSEALRVCVRKSASPHLTAFRYYASNWPNHPEEAALRLVDPTTVGNGVDEP